jgi:neutral ceramidase
MGGLSTGGQIARGYWLRLHARALYFEDAPGSAFALVACDLWSIPTGLSDRTAEIYAELRAANDALPPLGRSQIVLSASHTHHSPGHFSTDRFFAAFGAKGAGYDGQLLEFFARRFAHAIAKAAAQAEPAQLNIGSVDVPGGWWNRSIEPFLENAEAEGILGAAGAPPLDLAIGCPTVRKCKAVDQRVRVLRIEGREGRLLGAGVFLSTHPVLMGQHLGVNSSDLIGAVSEAAERRVDPARREDGPVVAVFNGAEGDVVGSWVEQDRSDVLRVAGAVVAKIGPLLEDGGRSIANPAVTMAWDEFSLRLERARTPDGKKHWTAFAPMPGRGTMAGGENAPSGLPHWLSKEGKRGLSYGAHGSKMGAMDLFAIGGFVVPPFWLTRLALAFIPPSRTVAAGVYRVGDLAFATLPGEFTTVMGRRIVGSVAEGAGLAHDDVIPIGLAQSYAYYFATPEEYQLQHYEGSGTLYGRYAGTLVENRLGELATKLEAPDAERRKYRYAPWLAGFMQKRSGPERATPAPTEIDRGVENVLMHVDGDLQLDAYPRWCWSDEVPGLRAPDDSSGPHRVTPEVWIEARLDSEWRPLREGGVREDDRGPNFLTLGHQQRKGATFWCSYWIPQAHVDPSLDYRFGVLDLGRRERMSSPFALD